MALREKGSEDLAWGESCIALMQDFREPSSGRCRLWPSDTHEVECNPGRQRGSHEEESLLHHPCVSLIC